MDAALNSGEIALNLYRRDNSGDSEMRFKLYHRGDPLPLSDALPMLENMGLKVIDEDPHLVQPAGSGSGARRHAVERLTAMVDDLKTAQNVNLTMLSVVNRELRALVNK